MKLSTIQYSLITMIVLYINNPLNKIRFEFAVLILNKIGKIELFLVDFKNLPNN